MKLTWLGSGYWFSALVVVLTTGAFPGESMSPPALPDGEEVARRINARDEGGSTAQTLVIETVDRRGGSRVRRSRTFWKDFGEERRKVIFFEEPRNVKGTAFLTIDYPEPGRDDDLWLYLPAARKVRRISMANRGDYFLGTDFTYEEVKSATRVNTADYSLKTLREEVVDGHRCLVLEAVPTSEKVEQELGYGRALQWVDAELWIFRRIEAWDTRGNELKTIEFKDIHQVEGIWTVHRIEALNHKTGHRSRFVFSDVDYDSEVEDELFTPQALRRGL